MKIENSILKKNTMLSSYVKKPTDAISSKSVNFRTLIDNTAKRSNHFKLLDTNSMAHEKSRVYR